MPQVPFLHELDLRFHYYLRKSVSLDTEMRSLCLNEFLIVFWVE